MAPKYLYKILDEPTPEPLPETLPATDLDTKDGFIHLSTAEQTRITAKLFFSSFDDLWILKLNTQALQARFSIDFSTDPNAGVENGCAHVLGSSQGLGRSNVVEVLKAHRAPEEEWTQVQSMKDLKGGD